MRALIAACLLVCSCTAQISSPSTTTPAPSPVPTVDPGPPALPSPLSRLTATQYQNTLQDLFAPIAVPPQSVPADVTVESFDNNAAVQTPSSSLIQAYQQSAVAIAAAAMASPAALLGCTPTDRTSEDACAASFLGTFLPKAFRRPIESDELSAYTDFYTSTRSDGTTDFPTAMTLVLEAVLQSPEFLYRVELGAPIAGRSDAVQLSPYEVASRLSYFLWNSMPDSALIDAAAAGGLAAGDGVQTQAQRLLADPRAHVAVANFHRQWLEFDKMKGVAKDPTLYPTFTTTTVTAMQDGAAKYVDNLFFSGGSLQTLLTDDHAYVNDALADIYGVTSPGPDLTLVQVDGTQRSGMLTNVGLMAAFAHETADSPVLRGVFVLSSIICHALPPPPAGVNTAVPAPSTTAPMTTRDNFALQHEQGACAACHHTIDGIGFGFEHYDATGKWRTEEYNLPIDSSGWFTSNYDTELSGTFDGAVDLGHRLAQSQTVQSCVAQNWLRYALGVDHTGVDSRGLSPIVADFGAAQFDMQALVVAITRSDAFNTRVVGATP